MPSLQPWLTLAAPVALLALAHLPHAGMALWAFAMSRGGRADQLLTALGLTRAARR